MKMSRSGVLAITLILALVLLIGGCVEAPRESPGQQTVTTAAPVQTPAEIQVQSPEPADTPEQTVEQQVEPVLRGSPGLKTVQVITGASGSQTVSVTVPAGYWELWYSADPLVTGGQDSHSATGTNSAVFPSLSINVMDARDGSEIRTVEPPGGLDRSLWDRAGDPRPWSEKFYQGNKEYTFDITARHLKSYVIEVRVRTA
jgi:hypothetical protein